MPPNQLSSCRQMFSAGGSFSRPVSTVAPVVVSPDRLSKNASVNVSPSMTSSSGTVAIAAIRIHASVTRMKPSRGFSSRL